MNDRGIKLLPSNSTELRVQFSFDLNMVGSYRIFNFISLVVLEALLVLEKKPEFCLISRELHSRLKMFPSVSVSVLIPMLAGTCLISYKEQFLEEL